MLKDTKRGPALKNRLVGDAEMHKGLLKRESLRATNGVKRGSLEMVKWIGRFSDGQLADVRHERENKDKVSILPM